MTMTVRDMSTAITPEEFEAQVEAAHQKAATLKRIVDAQRLSVHVGQSDHLKVEAWQTIGRGYGYSAATKVTQLLRNNDGEIIGAEAHADIIDNATGHVVGGADSFCFDDEEGKARQTVSQLAGMAQTRAESRAFKQMLSWVVVLAGYSPTPAEEMHGDVRRTVEAQAGPAFFCEEHQTQWFKRGKMRRYSHPIGDSEQWCDMPDAPKKPPISPAQPLKAANPTIETSVQPKSPQAIMADGFTALGLTTGPQKVQWFHDHAPMLERIDPRRWTPEQWQEAADIMRAYLVGHQAQEEQPEEAPDA